MGIFLEVKEDQLNQQYKHIQQQQLRQSNFEIIIIW